MNERATMVVPRSGRTMLGLPPVENPIKLGVVGLGHRSVGNVLPKAVRYEDYELMAICDIRPEIVNAVIGRVQEQHNVKVPGYTDFGQMLAQEDLDAVAVQIDPDKQIPLACQAMEAGCHVMVEVPTAYSMEDCWQAVVTTERTGKVFMLMEQTRFGGYVRAWRKIVETGVIGKPLFVEGEYFGYKPDPYFQDSAGRFYTPEQAKSVPDAKPTWRHLAPTIMYLPHELSPMLYVIDDRVTRVVGMSTRRQSYRSPSIEKADIQAALMHTEKDVVLRMAVGHSTTALPRKGGGSSHWHHVKGSEGVLEYQRSPQDKSKLWVEGWQLKEPIEVDWDMARVDSPAEAAGSGHGDLDYYVFAQFADAVLRGVPPELDVYKSVETAAPAILAAKSIAEDNAPQDVPDFRPGPNRKQGEMPRC